MTSKTKKSESKTSKPHTKNRNRQELPDFGSPVDIPSIGSVVSDKQRSTEKSVVPTTCVELKEFDGLMGLKFETKTSTTVNRQPGLVTQIDQDQVIIATAHSRCSVILHGKTALKLLSLLNYYETQIEQLPTSWRISSNSETFNKHAEQNSDPNPVSPEKARESETPITSPLETSNTKGEVLEEAIAGGIHDTGKTKDDSQLSLL